MSTVIFDGNGFAKDIYERLSDEAGNRKLKLVTIYDPENEGAKKYTETKAKKAKELDIDFEKLSIINYQLSINDLISQLNSDPGVDGIMIQMPLKDKKTDEELCRMINPKKDVDGLNPESGVMPATTRAVLDILKYALQIPNSKSQITKILVIGNKGIVGSGLVKELKCEGMDKDDFDPPKLLSADVVISCTGVHGLIKPEMVKEGVICIDVGYPKGDFAPETAKKAAFFTPVPGGVGPVTVAMLFTNLAELGYKNHYE